jgi:hypothetical protein
MVIVLVPFFSSLALAADSTPLTPIVVELFTSEGCSSCPPADSLLRTLDSSQPIAGAHLIVLEEHVDYWDDLGWKDPFSSHEFTVRQSEYARRLHVRAPYTPQMVVNGGTELLGSDARGANHVLSEARTPPAVAVRLSELRSENRKVHVHVEAGQVPSESELFMALALDHAHTQVRRGENSGRSLDHVAVLQSISGERKLHKGQSFSGDVTVSIAQPGSAYRLVAFIQEHGQGKIVGAAVENLRP